MATTATSIAPFATSADPSAAQLAGLLADADRRAVVAALVLGATTVADVMRVTGLTQRRAVTAVGRLIDGGLVEQGDGRSMALVAGAFSQAARAGASREREEHAGQPADIAKVLRAHMRDGRLNSIPASHTKRLIVLDVIVQDFEPDTHYTERQVNEILSRRHPDTAALRRWLVDVGYLDRDHGDYWRCGGPIVPTDDQGSAGDSSTRR